MRTMSDKTIKMLCEFDRWEKVGRYHYVFFGCEDCGREQRKRVDSVTSRKCTSCAHAGKGEISTAWKGGRALKVNMKCEDCGAVVRVRKDVLEDVRKTAKCQTCRSTGEGNTMYGRSGELSPHWQGGSVNWIEGRFSTDKDGLRWQAQRLLCLERDGYRCTKCHEEGNLEIHHGVPYRWGHSHALKLLVTLCRSCHKAEDMSLNEVRISEIASVLQVCSFSEAA